jgi:hypothetical protein
MLAEIHGRKPMTGTQHEMKEIDGIDDSIMGKEPL